ncbi:MAG: hypothetical protein OJF49_002587 [Ktedonobacterales bacterium]|jgi:hypothetical protein|nr:MAG: hypothetical protein OJF49_002587 [Ktedonobacterales bacterium]
MGARMTQGRTGERHQRGVSSRALPPLLIAVLWLVMLLFACGGVQVASAFSHSSSNIPLPSTPSNTPTSTSDPSPTATSTPSKGPPPTRTPPPGTATPSTTTTPTGTAIPPTATAPPSGGGNNGGGGPIGPQPTKVVFTQPTAAAGANGPLQGLASGTFASNGLLLATTSGCIVALLGVIIAAIALMVLLRDGYGPFLRVLLLDKRAKASSPAGADPSDSGMNGMNGANGMMGSGALWEGDPRVGYDDRPYSSSRQPSARRPAYDDQYDQDDRYDRGSGTGRYPRTPAPPARGPSSGRTPPPPARNRPASGRTPPPPPRRRDNWR